jgi:hypothetical protein
MSEADPDVSRKAATLRMDERENGGAAGENICSKKHLMES